MFLFLNLFVLRNLYILLSYMFYHESTKGIQGSIEGLGVNGILLTQ